MHQFTVGPIVLGCIQPYRTVKYFNGAHIKPVYLLNIHSFVYRRKTDSKINAALSPYHLIIPRENFISEIISFLWWKETMSSTVSAFTTRKLPSFKPTAKAFPSGEKAQHRPPAEENGREYLQVDKLGSERTINELQLKGFYIKYIPFK